VGAAEVLDVIGVVVVVTVVVGALEVSVVAEVVVDVGDATVLSAVFLGASKLLGKTIGLYVVRAGVEEKPSIGVLRVDLGVVVVL
jgi:hypothetical protein